MDKPKFSIVVLTHNRLKHLKQCINHIVSNTDFKNNYEILVVNNYSTDGTKEWLDTEFQKLKAPLKTTAIHMETNEGVIARNYAFKKAEGEIIVQIDDDVVVLEKWDKQVLPHFDNEPQLGALGVQGGIISKWMDLDVWKTNNGYVDFITGFFWAFRNVGLYYDEAFGAFWKEEDDLCYQFKEAGYRLKLISNTVCCHDCQRRGPIDWDLHNRNTEYVRNKWKDKLDKLRLGGF